MFIGYLLCIFTTVMKNALIAEILSDASLWQADLSDMADIVSAYYEKITQLGAKEAMKW